MEDELNNFQGLPGGPDFENLPCNVGGVGWIPSQGSKSQQAALCCNYWALCFETHTTRESVHCNKRTHLLQIRTNAAKKKKKTVWKRGGLDY